MTALLIVLPIILLLFIVFMIKTGVRWKFINVRGSRWIIVGYGTILAISTIIFIILPHDSDKEYRRLSDKEMEQINNYDYTLDVLDSAKKGKIENTKGVYRNKKWEFDFTGEKLSLVKGDGIGTLVVVEKKDKNDGKVEVSSYASELIIENVASQEKLNPPGVELNGENLRIIMPEMQELNYSMINKEFTITQFKQKKSINDYQGSMTMAHEILYIRIPKDVIISGSDFEFVEK
ncbi:hypothetical protein FZW96_03295 [Bacillus sp. BGMRC 2118]|nr:hypothetical protein FZW96_03295 [Bacillus sp. BGMRC 2118]